MQTYTPISGMIVCANGAGDFVRKTDADSEIKRLRDALAFISRTVDTSQTCSKGNEEIAVVAMDALGE
jgi:hypothetical protein